MFDPKCHFLKDDAPKVGDRVILPAGTHIIPTESQLANLPDRFENLSTPETPAEVEVDDDDGEDDDPDDDPDDEPEDDEPEEHEPSTPSEADQAVDDALSEVNGSWNSLTSPQLEVLADGYEIEASNIEGSGSGGNVLKADWIRAIQGARGAA
jgi:pyruvate/2-oxoglutarate dehydrogenase complex dihydrolipoamide acyltransferase (E2) component